MRCRAAVLDLAALATLSFAAPCSAAPVLVAEGSEFPLNSHAAGAQNSPQVDCLDDGRCVAAWQSQGQDGDAAGVFVRSLDSNGVVGAPEQAANTMTAGDQADPDVCMHASGAFVVVWSGNGSGDADGVFYRRFDSSGAPVDDEVLVNTTIAGGQFAPKVACTGDGGFVVAWNAPLTMDPARGIYARIFDSAGAAPGAEFRVNDDALADRQQLGGVAETLGGGFVVVWDRDLQYPFHGLVTATTIVGRRFDAAGSALGGTFLIGSEPWITYPQSESWVIGSDVAGDASGGFSVAWTEGWGYCLYDASGCESDFGDIRVRNYDASGNETAALGVGLHSTLGSADLDALYGPSIAAGAVSVLAIWDVFPRDVVMRPGLPAMLPDLTANLLSSDLEEGSASVPNQSSIGARRSPAVAAAGNERYFAAWVADAQDGDGSGIFARRFCADTDGDGACDRIDPCPLDAQDDEDGDGICGDADGCPSIPDPGQSDSDGDGVGDACDACRGSDDSQDEDEDGIPDGCDLCAGNDEEHGNFEEGGFLQMGNVANGDDGDDTIRFKGVYVRDVAAYPALHGARLRIATASGTVLVDAVLPPGEFGGGGTAGWRPKGSQWFYLDRTAAPIEGIVLLRTKKRIGGLTEFTVVGRRGSYAIAPGDEPLSLTFETDGSEAVCVQRVFPPSNCGFDPRRARIDCK